MTKISKTHEFSESDHLNFEQKESFFVQNDLLKKLAPSNKRSYPLHLAQDFIRKILQFFKGDSSSVIESRIVRLLQKDEEGLSNLDIFNHYKKWLSKDKSLRGQFSVFERFARHEQKVQRLSEKGEAKQFDKLLKETLEDLSSLKEGESRLFAMDRDFEEHHLNPKVFCLLTKEKEGWTVVLSGTGSFMKNLSDVHFVKGKQKVSRELVFKGVPVEKILTDHWLKTWCHPENLKTEEMKALIDPLNDHLIKTKSLDSLVTKTDRLSKQFWNVLSSFPSSKNESRNIKKVRLRAHLLQLFEMYQTHHRGLKPESKAYKNLKIVFENVSREVLFAYKKGEMKDDDLLSLQKELQIIENSLIRAKSKKQFSFTSKAPSKKIELQGFFESRPVKGGNNFTPVASLISQQTLQKSRAPKPLQFAEIDHPVSIELHPFRNIHTKEEALGHLRELKLKWESQPESREATQQEIIEFFHDVPMRLADRIVDSNTKEAKYVQSDSFWWTLSQDEMNEVFPLLDTWMNEITQTAKNAKSIDQTTYEVLGKMIHLNYAWEVNIHGVRSLVPPSIVYRIEDYGPIFSLGGHFNYRINPSHLTVFSEINGDMERLKNSQTHHKFVNSVKDSPLTFPNTIKLFQYYERIRSYAGTPAWQRPIQDPYLLAFSESIRTVIRDQRNSYELPEETGVTHEAFQNEPEAVFDYLLDKYTDPFGMQNERLSKTPHAFTAEEEKSLLHLLRARRPQHELMAFMEKQPHLMRNPDVRNYFQKLFFSTSLIGFLSNYAIAKEVPERLETKILSEKKRLEQMLANSQCDQDLLRGQFEYVGFLIEMHSQLKGIYANPNLLDVDTFYFLKPLHEIEFKDLKGDLQELLHLCDDYPLLAPQKGYIASILLHEALQAEPLNENAGDLFTLFALALTQEVPAYHKDLIQEHDLRFAWKKILQGLVQRKELFEGEKIAGFLDAILTSKKLPLGKEAWKHEGNFVFSNENYKVDLVSMTVQSKELNSLIELIPGKILQDKTFKKLFPEFDEGTSFPVQVEKQDRTARYQFTIPDKGSFVVEQNEEHLTYYRLTSQGKWLQHVSSSIYSNLPAFMSENLYVDPQNSSKQFVVDHSGKEIFELEFKKGKHGLILENVIDLRAEKESFQLNLGSDLKDSKLEGLLGIEHSKNILLWSQKGKIKKVELPRYGLEFRVEGRRLICTTPKFKDYYVLMNPSLKDKNQLSSSIVLEHPNPKKPRKLLLASSHALQISSTPVETKAAGLSKFIQKMQPPLTEREKLLQVNPYGKKLSYLEVDLRPFTNEIILGPQAPFDKYLELASHFLAEGNPVEMLHILERLPLNKIEKKSLEKLLFFLDAEGSSDKSVAAVKLKITLRLKAELKKRGSEKNLLQRLNTTILKQAKVAVPVGGKVPSEIQFSNDERLEITKIAQKLGVPFASNEKMSMNFEEVFGFESGELAEAIESWKQKREPRTMAASIQALESEIHPEELLENSSLSDTFERLPVSEQIFRLFEPKEINELFNEETTVIPPFELKTNIPLKAYEEHHLTEINHQLAAFSKEQSQKIYLISASPKKLRSFLEERIVPKHAECEEKLYELRLKIEQEIRHSSKQEEQLEIFAGNKGIASFEEIKLHFAKGTLKALKENNRLPSELNLRVLEADLRDYFETMVKRNALESAEILIQEAMQAENPQDPEQIKILSQALHHLLTLRCQYDAEKHPQLLIFEAQQFLQFKSLDAGLDQLQLIEKMLADPRAVIQAPTGSGKTAVLAVMRSLLKPNGKNLVVQKVMPQLFQQTYDKYQEVLGELFGNSIYALRFNLKMRLTEPEYVKKVDENGLERQVKQEASIFKRMYHDLLTTIKNQGCVLTDYKSFPLIEESFWKLGQELVERTEQGLPITDLQREHFTYLRKIVILLSNKNEELMDEFDKPNRPIHKIQLDMSVGSHPIPSRLIDSVLEIYDFLLEDQDLMLRENVTADFTEKMRQERIESAAAKMADRIAQGNEELSKKLLEYFLGRNEEVLNLIETFDPAIKDKIALCKDEFSVFLPLTLRGKEGSKYARSDDGLRTLPCESGEKHEAKHGSLLEQINYLIQDYYQAGITAVDLKLWLTMLKKKSEDADETRLAQLLQQLHAVLPEMELSDLELVLKDPQIQKEIVQQVNENPIAIQHFLKYRLAEIKTSGAVVSMGPQEIIEMSAAVSGISATVGSSASLHPQFNVDEEMNGKIRAQMTYRIANRAISSPKVSAEHLKKWMETLLQESEKGDKVKSREIEKQLAHFLPDIKLKNIKDLIENPQELKNLAKQINSDPVGLEKFKAIFPLQATPVIFFDPSNPSEILEEAKLPLQSIIDGAGVFRSAEEGAQALLETNSNLLQVGYHQTSEKIKFVGEEVADKEKTGFFFSQAHTRGTDIPLPSDATALLTLNERDGLRDYFQKEGRLRQPGQKYQLAISKYRDNVSDLQQVVAEAVVQDSQIDAQDIFKAKCDQLKSVVRKEAKKDLLDRDEIEAFVERFADPDMRGLFILPAQSHYSEPGDFFAQHKHLRFTNEKPEKALHDYKAKLIEQTKKLNLAQAGQELEEISFPPELLTQMPEWVTPVGTHEDLGLELQVEQEEEFEVEDELEISLEIEENQAAESKAALGIYPQRVEIKGDHHIQQKIHPAYDPKLFVSDAFLPLSRTSNSLRKRTPFDAAMYRVGTVYVRTRDQNGEIIGIYLEDPLGDTDQFRDRSHGFWWDMRTQSCLKSRSLRCDPKAIVKSEEFIPLAAQIKFFDGQVNDYTDEELKSLAAWLQINDPVKMHDHFLNQILQYRYQDKIDFVGSQLDKLFNSL